MCGMGVVVDISDGNSVITQSTWGQYDVEVHAIRDIHTGGLIDSFSGHGIGTVGVVPRDIQVAGAEDVDGAVAREFLPVVVGDSDALDGYVALHGYLRQAAHVAELHTRVVVAPHRGVLALAESARGQGLFGADDLAVEVVVFIHAQVVLVGIDAIVVARSDVLGYGADKGCHAVGKVGEDEVGEIIAAAGYRNGVVFVPQHAAIIRVVVSLGIAVLDGDDGVVVGALQGVVLLAAHKGRAAHGGQQGYT